jgi:hypothetical protein
MVAQVRWFATTMVWLITQLGVEATRSRTRRMVGVVMAGDDSEGAFLHLPPFSVLAQLWMMSSVSVTKLSVLAYSVYH